LPRFGGRVNAFGRVESVRAEPCNKIDTPRTDG